jgi:hypothetical protein
MSARSDAKKSDDPAELVWDDGDNRVAIRVFDDNMQPWTDELEVLRYELGMEVGG